MSFKLVKRLQLSGLFEWIFITVTVSLFFCQDFASLTPLLYKGQHDEEQQDRESPRRKSSFERVSVSSSEFTYGVVSEGFCLQKGARKSQLICTGDRRKKSIHHHRGTPLFSVCRPTPRSQSKKSYGVYLFPWENKGKGVYTIGPVRRVYTIEPQTRKKKKRGGLHGGGVYFFFPGRNSSSNIIVSNARVIFMQEKVHVVGRRLRGSTMRGNKTENLREEHLPLRGSLRGSPKSSERHTGNDDKATEGTSQSFAEVLSESWGRSRRGPLQKTFCRSSAKFP